MKDYTCDQKDQMDTRKKEQRFLSSCITTLPRKVSCFRFMLGNFWFTSVVDSIVILVRVLRLSSKALGVLLVCVPARGHGCQKTSCSWRYAEEHYKYSIPKHCRNFDERISSKKASSSQHPPCTWEFLPCVLWLAGFWHMGITSNYQTLITPSDDVQPLVRRYLS